MMLTFVDTWVQPLLQINSKEKKKSFLRWASSFLPLFLSATLLTIIANFTLNYSLYKLNRDKPSSLVPGARV